MSEQLTGFAKIKWEVAQIQFKYLGMNQDRTAIEANPSTHRIAEYIEANYIPKPSPGDNQSLEEAAEKYCQKNYDPTLSGWKTVVPFFLAGAAYGKGGEEKNWLAYYSKDIEKEINKRWASLEYNPEGTISRESLRLGAIQHVLKNQQLPSRPSIDIVDELKKANRYRNARTKTPQYREAGWDEACNKLQELLNQSK